MLNCECHQNTLNEGLFKNDTSLIFVKHMVNQKYANFNFDDRLSVFIVLFIKFCTKDSTVTVIYYSWTSL